MTDFEKILINRIEINIGAVPELKIETKNDKITVFINSQTIFNIRLNDNNFIVSEKLTNELILPIDFFQIYIDQVIERILIPSVVKLYKNGYLKTIPSKFIEKIDLSKITIDWIKSNFEEISEEDGNSETIDKIEIAETEDGIDISFELDCGRYGIHRNNNIRITKKGDVITNLAEIIDGGEIDAEIKRRIEKIIK